MQTAQPETESLGMKTECMPSVRLAVVMGHAGSVLLVRGRMTGGEEAYALPSLPIERGESFRAAVQRVAVHVGVANLTDVALLAVVNGRTGTASEGWITLAVSAVATDFPSPHPASSAPHPASSAPHPASSAPHPASAGSVSPALIPTCLPFASDHLPLLEPWTQEVLHAARMEQRVVDADGTFVALGYLPGRAARKTEDETTATDFSEQLRRVKPSGEYKGWLGASLMFGGGLAWSTGVFGVLSEPGQLGGDTALLFWLMTVPLTWGLAIRRGYFQPPSNPRALVFRLLLAACGAVLFLLPCSLAAASAGEASAWILVLLGLGTYLTVLFRRRKNRVERRDRPSRLVGAMVWATLVFTTLWVLSPGLRELLDELHSAGASSAGLGTGDAE